MMTDKVKMYIISRHTVHDTPKQIADSLGKDYTEEAVAKILRDSGYKPHMESVRSETAEKREQELRKIAVKKLRNKPQKKQRFNPRNVKLPDSWHEYVPQTISKEKYRKQLRLLHAEGKSVSEIAEKTGFNSHQVEDTLIDMSLRPIYGSSKKKTKGTNAKMNTPILTNEEKERIKVEYDSGTTKKELASKYNVSVTTINRAISWAKGKAAEAEKPEPVESETTEEEQEERTPEKQEEYVATADLPGPAIDLNTAIARTAEIASGLNWDIYTLTATKHTNGVTVQCIINGENAPRSVRMEW